jgi:hypothetical protein
VPRRCGKTSKIFGADLVRQFSLVSTAIFEPRLEVLQHTSIYEGVFSAASLMLELLKDHWTSACFARAVEFSLMSRVIYSRALGFGACARFSTGSISAPLYSAQFRGFQTWVNEGRISAPVVEASGRGLVAKIASSVHILANSG